MDRMRSVLQIVARRQGQSRWRRVQQQRALGHAVTGRMPWATTMHSRNGFLAETTYCVQDQAHSKQNLRQQRSFTSRGGKFDGRSGDGSGTRSINNKNNNTQPKKENFDRTILEPSSRGELRGKHHDSGIPRLAARKSKPHFYPPTRQDIQERLQQKIPVSDAGDVLGGDNVEEGEWEERFGPGAIGMNDEYSDGDDDEYDDEFDGDYEGYDQESMMNAVVVSAGDAVRGSGGEDMSKEGFRRTKGNSGTKMPLQWRTLYDEQNGDSKDEELLHLLESDNQYWDESNFDIMFNLTEEDREALECTEGEDADDEENTTKKTRKEEYDEDIENENDYDTDDPEVINLGEPDDGDSEDLDFLQRYEEKNYGDVEEDEEDGEDLGFRFLPFPLQNYDGSVEEFNEAMFNHPTDYAYIDFKVHHPESRREPKPDFPPNRVHPPEEFLDEYQRFLYITGLPPMPSNTQKEEESSEDGANGLQQEQTQAVVARLFGVDKTHVFPEGPTTAYIGFKSASARAAAMVRGPKQKHYEFPPIITKYVEKKEELEGADAQQAMSSKAKDFVAKLPESVIVIEHMPAGHNAKSLLGAVFPSQLEDRTLTPDDVFFLSASKILIRFGSSEDVEKALQGDDQLNERLHAIGQYRVRFFRARRELLHAGLSQDFPREEYRSFGPRLIVEGLDMPGQEFFNSHYRVVKIRDLDPDTSKEELTTVFQPFCTRTRDIESSIEIVTCEEGIPTGKAYVGFDFPGEAETAVRANNGSIMVNDRRAKMHLVRTRQIPNRPSPLPDMRPQRSEQELLADLNNWQRFVTEDDLKELEKKGIDLDVVDEAIRVARYKNPSFGPFDSGLRSESIDPKRPPGDHFKEFVQTYVETLKNVAATPEDVGDTYPLLFTNEEEMDMSIFQEEENRKQLLRKQRYGKRGRRRVIA